MFGIEAAPGCSLKRMVLLSGNYLRFIPCLFLAAVSLVGTIEAKPSVESSLNLRKGGLALGGYDPLSYFREESPVKGDPKLALEVAGARYLFASEENLAAFAAEPQKYQPAFGGWCAWAMLDGEKVDVDPRSFRIFDGKLLLFYDGLWGDTRSKWIEKSEASAEETLVEQAQTNWKHVLLKREK